MRYKSGNSNNQMDNTKYNEELEGSFYLKNIKDQTQLKDFVDLYIEIQKKDNKKSFNEFFYLEISYISRILIEIRKIINEEVSEYEYHEISKDSSKKEKFEKFLTFFMSKDKTIFKHLR
jgi:hypothetical protein